MGYLICNLFDEPKRLHFIVDTGCTTTTILPMETKRLGIEWKRLPYSNGVETATSRVVPRTLHEVSVVFIVENNENGELVPRIFDFPRIDVMPPPSENIFIRFLNWLEKVLSGEYQAQAQDHVSPVLVGMDFLSNFKHWEFTDNELILDT